MIERSFLMIKPDGVVRGLCGEVISRLEKKGLKIVAMKMIQVTREIAEKQYEIHREKEFFKSLINYVTSAPSLVMVIDGKEAVKVIRNLIGATNPVEANSGTIRGDFAMFIERNIVHAADSPENAIKELSLYFSEEEILPYKKVDEDWLYSE